MEMIRWLLGNRIVQVAWGLGLLAVLLAWAFGGSKASHDIAEVDSHAKTEQVAEASVETKDVDTSVVAEVKQEAEEVVAEVKQEAEEVVADTKAVVAAGTAAVVATAAATVQAVVDTGEAAVEAVKGVDEAVEETVVADVTATQETAEVEAKTQEATEVADTEVANTAETSEVALADGLAEKSSEDLLMMAREAYWNNGLDEAAELYATLIEREPNVIEHKGELGNVFWRQGFPKKAAELYADIAEPMIEKGNGERVSNMVGFIGLFFPERAATIRTLLEK